MGYQCAQLQRHSMATQKEIKQIYVET